MNQTAALQGDALHAFLDQAQELVLNDEHDEQTHAISREDRIAASVELMEQQSFAPATALELERLHDVWLLLNRPETANALLQADRSRVLAPDASPAPDSAARLALSDLQSRSSFDKVSAISLLLPTAQTIAQLPEEYDAGRYWQGWHHYAKELQAWETAAIGVDMERAQENADPDLATDSAYLDALASVHKAELAVQSHKEAQAASLVQSAINTLRDAPADQAVDFDRWMQLADRALPVAPQSLPALLMACEQQVARTEHPPASQAVLAHRKVKIIRLQAQACAQAGQLEAALQLAPQGHFGLTDDDGDPFTAIQLGWLVQANRMDEAADLALESALHARPVSAVAAYELALQRFDTDPARSITWALILAHAQMDEDMRYLLAQQPRASHPAAFYLNMVRAAQPQNPVLALLEGTQLAEKRQMAQALPLLEKSVGLHPELADSDKLPALWAARFAALPLDEALSRPFPEAHGAHWCYAAGVVLDDEDDLAPLMGGKQKVPSDEAREPLVVRYYEEGLRRFEHFWATGQGEFKDADLHVYSMLCNNLGIKYRYQDRYDEAAELHRKGLASSPFAEHHEGLWWAANGRGDDAGIVAEAEGLWHFAQQHGYGRHEPPRYLPTVALSLYKLDRGDEISIWLERLDHWFAELDEEEQKQERRDYLAATMSLLDFFSVFRPEQVLPRLRAYQDEVRALKDSYPLRRLACALEAYPELLEESVALHRESASYLGRHSKKNFALGNDNEAEAQMSAENLASAERKLAEHKAQAQPAGTANRKPWWKLW